MLKLQAWNLPRRPVRTPTVSEERIRQVVDTGIGTGGIRNRWREAGVELFKVEHAELKVL